MKPRLIQYLAIILILTGIAGGYFYYHSKADQKINASKVNNLTSGLAGYWTFDGADTTTTTAMDKSTAGKNGTLSGSPTPLPAIGKIGQSLNFNGTTSYIDVTGITSAINPPFSFGAWIRLNSVPAANKVIAVKSGSFTMRATTTGIECVDTNTGRGTAKALTWAASQWYHIACVISASDLTGAGQTIYVNGSNSGTTSDGWYGVDSGTSLKIGSNGSGAYFDGQIDEVRYYSRALSQSEITELYQQGQTKINASQDGKLENGLVVYYTMDGNNTTWTSPTAGTTADKSPVGTNTGTLGSMSQATNPAIGKIGQAMYFSGGDDDYIEKTSATGLPQGNNPFSVSAWAKFIPTSKAHYMITWGSMGTRLANWTNITSAGKLNHINYGNSGDGPANVVMSANTWHHVVVTYDGTTRKFYEDGVYDKSNTPQAMNVTGSDLVIGYDVNGNGEGFKGSMDEIRIYNRAITQSEITELYQQGQTKINASQTNKLTNGLVVYQTFDGNNMDWSQASAEARDISGNNNHGDVTNMTNVKAAPGKSGQALNFDGTSDYVDMGDVNALDGQSYLTMSAWVKLGATGPYDQIIGKFQDLSNSFDMYIDNDTYPQAAAVRVANGAGNYFVTPSLSLTSSIGSWHLWTMVFDGTQTGNANRLKFYYDGVQQTLDFISGSVPATTPASTGSLHIGKDNNQAPNALIDEARIYSRALSQSEVTELYNQGR